MESPLIIIRNLHKIYPGASHPSVDGLTLRVGKGMFFGLLGPNGAGKTTTISILCGLCSYDGGEVTVNGFDVRRKMKDVKSLIGVVPQDIALYPELTVDENLRFFGGMYPVSSQELNTRIESYLNDFNLIAHRRKKVAALSGGMKRQTNLIAALLHQPALLFLDEPTVGVDVHSRQVILGKLRSLHRNGMTIVYTSHDMKEAAQLCTQVVLMNHGRLVCEGVPRQLVGDASVSSLEELFIKETQY
jgi:ABC-2 type transport system ATP-binding protein